ncbi:putative tpr domain-containing protein [Fusarium flagelliforme]|uniref:Putative tpr domain-containing protein n=1 Tax=Fusarium flagelliforme TaxID=2675880 RepID=A0A395N4L4_9HYPO|nr:putative tpr domain-containing protein [Fusarium flagelliforme]
MISDTTSLMLRAWLHLSEQVAGQILRYILIGLFIFCFQELLDIWLQNDYRIEHQTTEVLSNPVKSKEIPTTDPEHRATSKPIDLEEGLLHAQKALDLTTSDEPYRAGLLQNLGIGYRLKFTTSHSQQDLERQMDDMDVALSKFEEALVTVPDDHPYRPGYLHNLSKVYNKRYDKTKGLEDLERAIQTDCTYETKVLRRSSVADIEMAGRYFQEAVDLTPEGDPKKSERLLFLALLYDARYQISGLKADLDEMNRLVEFQTSKDPSDLEASLQRFKQALDVLPNDPFSRKVCLQSLAHANEQMYQQNRSLQDLETAIRYQEKAIASAPGNDPDQAAYLTELNDFYQSKHKVTLEQVDIDAAVEKYKAGMALFSIFANEEKWTSAHRIASTSMDLVPFLTPWFLANADKQHLVTEMSNFAGDAAAVALRAGQPPGTAIHLLEQGRGIISSSLNEMRRDLSDLENAYPDQARKLSKLREELDSPENSAGVDQRYSSAEMLESLIKEIRSLPGFDRFLLPPTEEDIKAAASHGPIVVLNASQYRCTALVVLGWLWDTIASPVLEFLGMHESSTDHWPRIWWIPVGILSKFPIHGAGYHVSGLGCTVLDRVISSYSSSIKAMIHSRRSHTSTRELSRSKNAILVGVETTPGHRRLPYITEEVQRLEDFCNAPYLTIKRREPYRQEVIDTLRDCDIFHFAGHRLCDSNDPSGSALLLGDGPLTVETLLEMNMQRRRPFLAYLSACGTGQIDHEGLINEGLQLIGACQVAGFQHVIGTLWQVDDKFSVNVAIMMYEWMQKHDMGGAAVSEGLHHTSRMFRDKWISG